MDLGISPTRTDISKISLPKRASPGKISQKLNPKPQKPIAGKQSTIRKQDHQNPWILEEFEGINTHMSNIKTIKGHLMGVTSLDYN